MASSSIIVVKGLPVSLLLDLLLFDTQINLNDTTWVVDISLRHRTVTGEEPFEVNVEATSNSILVGITPEQTLLLDSMENTYILVIKISKVDGTVFLRNSVQMSVVDDI